MSGKHDKAADEAPAKLTLTGPIVVRGLGRGMKGTFRPSRSGRHRASAKAVDGEPAGSVPSHSGSERSAYPGGADTPGSTPGDQLSQTAGDEWERRVDDDQQQGVAGDAEWPPDQSDDRPDGDDLGDKNQDEVALSNPVSGVDGAESTSEPQSEEESGSNRAEFDAAAAQPDAAASSGRAEDGSFEVSGSPSDGDAADPAETERHERPYECADPSESVGYGDPSESADIDADADEPFDVDENKVEGESIGEPTEPEGDPTKPEGDGSESESDGESGAAVPEDDSVDPGAAVAANDHEPAEPDLKPTADRAEPKDEPRETGELHADSRDQPVDDSAVADTGDEETRGPDVGVEAAETPPPASRDVDALVGWFTSPPSEDAPEQERLAGAVTDVAPPAAPAATTTATVPERTLPTSRRRVARGHLVRRELLRVTVLLVLALICAGLVTAAVLKSRHDAAVAAQESRDYSPSPLTAAGSSPTSSPTVAAGSSPVIAIVGDETVTKAASGVTASARWPALTEDAVKGDVLPASASDAGYAGQSPLGKTIGDLVPQVPANADVIIFVGGSHDATVAPLSLAKAASEAFAAAKAQAPEASLVVIGPVVADGASQADLTSVRSVLRSAAFVAKATWVDPIAAKWVPSAQTGTLGALSAAYQKAIAVKVESAVKIRLKQ